MSILSAVLIRSSFRLVWEVEAKDKNKFYGDGVEFFRKILHNDNLPFAVFSAGCIYLLERGYLLECRVDVIDKKFDVIDKKFDKLDENRQFFIIVALVAVKQLPDEIAKSIEAKNRIAKNVADAEVSDATDAANK
jgi:hypothetical protein